MMIKWVASAQSSNYCKLTSIWKRSSSLMIVRKIPHQGLMKMMNLLRGLMSNANQFRRGWLTLTNRWSCEMFQKILVLARIFRIIILVLAWIYREILSVSTRNYQITILVSASTQGEARKLFRQRCFIRREVYRLQTTEMISTTSVTMSVLCIFTTVPLKATAKVVTTTITDWTPTIWRSSKHWIKSAKSTTSQRPTWIKRVCKTNL